MNIIKTVADLKKALSVYDDSLPVTVLVGSEGQKMLAFLDMNMYRLDEDGEQSFVIDARVG